MTSYVFPGIAITPDLIIKASGQAYGIELNPAEHSRRRPDCDARKLAMLLIRSTTRLALREIGVMFRRDHATVTYSCRTIIELARFNRATRGRIESAARNIGMTEKEITKMINLNP